MIYADGVKPAKAFKKECWPVFIGLCELPRSVRDSKKNKIISGVWIGGSKPSSDILFENLFEDLEKLNSHGIEIVKKDRRIQIKVGLYGFCGDGPSRSLALNMVEHMGYYPCYYCLIRGLFLVIFYIKNNVRKKLCFKRNTG